MNSEQIEEIINKVISEGIFFPWWNYVLAILIGFLGSFLGAYFIRKGDNLATKENYNVLLEQIRQTTHAAESIKTDLGKISWLNKQDWVIKEKYYSALLGALSKLKSSLSGRLFQFYEPGSNHYDEQITESDDLKIQIQLRIEAIKQLEEIRGPAEIVISQKAIKALEIFDSKEWSAKVNCYDTQQYVENVFEAVKEAYDVVLSEARLELKQYTYRESTEVK